MHDLSYVHPKHFEKIFGKTGAAKLWEDLKRYRENLGPVDTAKLTTPTPEAPDS